LAIAGKLQNARATVIATVQIRTVALLQRRAFDGLDGRMLLKGSAV